MARWTHEGEVTMCGLGTGFPLDMLRYDCCWPKTDKDTQTIADTLSNLGVEAGVKIRVMRVTDSKKDPWTYGRWQSFRAPIVHIESRR